MAFTHVKARPVVCANSRSSPHDLETRDKGTSREPLPMTPRLLLWPHLLKVLLPSMNTILESKPQPYICHLAPNSPLRNPYSRRAVSCMASEEAPISLASPGSSGSDLRWWRGWLVVVGGGVPGSSVWEPRCWHSVQGRWHGREAGSSVASWILLMLVLVDGEAVLQRSPGDPSEEWASFPAFRSVTQTESAPPCCSFLMGCFAETNSNEHHW